MAGVEDPVGRHMIPISSVGGRFLLFSIDDVTYLRREHRICGVLIGSLPQAPQQNVFLGLPLQLMPEEVQLLTEKGLAYVVDDAMVHSRSLADASVQGRHQYLRALHDKGAEAAGVQAAIKEGLKAKALGRAGATPKTNQDVEETTGLVESADQDALFSSPHPSKQGHPAVSARSIFGVTPATSAPLVNPTAPPPMSSTKFTSRSTIPVPASYPLFKHLNYKGYFVSPGLRFGCQYLVYPGDPLRFHSHFLASYVGWDQELDLMDLVGGGRLGTGVKKAYLIGGQQEQESHQVEGKAEADTGNVRTFSIEWAAM